MPSAALTVSDLEIRRQSINVFASICHVDKKFIKFYSAVFITCYRNFEQWSKAILSDIGLAKVNLLIIIIITDVASQISASSPHEYHISW
jgi:hypothetical protein